MQLTVKVDEIECSRRTKDRNWPDQMYLAYFVTGVKRDGDKKAAVKQFKAKKLSTVQKGVGRGFVWQPVAYDDKKPMTVTVKDDDAEGYVVVLALYERDDGEIYEKLKGKVESPIVPDELDWKTIDLPNNPANIPDLLSSIYKFIRKLIGHWREDDLLQPYHNDLAQGMTTHSKSMTMRGHGGKYRIKASFEIA